MNKTAEIFISRSGKMIKEKGLTQRELASKVGVTEVSMSRYIKGERVPSGPIVVNIAKELGIWYKNWSRRKYPNMIDWYSEKLNPPTWRKKEIYIDENGKRRIRDCK